MSGTKVIRYLLANNAPLTAVVAAEKIAAGTVPQNTELPAIGMGEISGFQHKTVAMSTTGNLVSERIQITVYATTYPQLKEIMALVRSALPLSKGTVASVTVDGVTPDSDGPYLYDHDTETHEQSMDYFVKFAR